MRTYVMKNLDRQLRWIFEDKYNKKWHPGIISDMRRLKSGEPVDYIIEWKPFLNCKINLLYKPLIPRPETEFWTEKAIKILNNISQPLKIADVFSGSGCIGIAILKNIKNSKVDFFEIDPNLIKQIKINLKLNGINKSRFRVIKADIFSGSANTSGKNKYNFIFANPPYVAKSRKDKIQKSVLKYEPEKALFGGKDGMHFIKKFLAQAESRLNSGGQIWMEFDSFQKPLIEKIFKNLNYSKWEFKKDQYGKWRWIILTND